MMLMYTYSLPNNNLVSHFCCAMLATNICAMTSAWLEALNRKVEVRGRVIDRFPVAASAADAHRPCAAAWCQMLLELPGVSVMLLMASSSVCRTASCSLS